MASTRPLMTARLEVGFSLQFSLKQLYPYMTAGDVYALQLRAYLPTPFRSIRVLHSMGQATVHVAHTLVCISNGAGSRSNGQPVVAQGGTQVPEGLATGALHHLHVSITCALSCRCHEVAEPVLALKLCTRA